MKENLQRHLLGLQGGVSRVEDQLAAMPAQAELFHDGIRLFQAEFNHRRRKCLFDELLQRHGQAMEGGLRFGGFQAGGNGFHRAPAVVELNLRRDFGDGLDRAEPVLRMPHAHPDME